MLPAGYKFLPTDEELFLHYLQPKVSGSQMPVNVIPEIDLQNYDPTHLQGMAFNNGCGDYYFFTKDHQGMMSPDQLSNGEGYYENTGINEPALNGNGILIGTKRSFSYKLHNDITCTMYEYRLAGGNSTGQTQQGQQQQWMLVKIVHKQEKQQFENRFNVNDDDFQPLTDSDSDHNDDQVLEG
ncbi:NAC domain-containing protein 104 [Cinnamomum micranthum f. kanehirae]|uniref:NAC domain-containing protein 104 n=1 Tax=Cinnamomum micranthum f. kanehirae TaxID=337451 RepID=A0A3S3M243_9MAGN|nr:NAC domain-containing protein 104 [Cinnamomum micranthum f. kanehirae]